MAKKVNLSNVGSSFEDVSSELGLQVLFVSIQTYHQARFGKDEFSTRQKLTISDYKLKIEDLQEYFSDVKSILGHNSIETHQYLWMESLSVMVDVLLDCNGHFCKKYINISPFDLESYMRLMESVGPILNQLTSDLGILLERFLTSDVLSIQKLTVTHAFPSFQKLLYNALELLIMDRVDDTNYLNFSEFLLNHIQQCLVTIFKTDPSVVHISLPIITQFVRVIYMVGESPLLLIFAELPVINPKFPIEVIEKVTVDYRDVLYYYKFVALNYLALSILSDSIEFNKEADLYFNVLLYLPNLSIPLFHYGDSKIGKALDRDPDAIFNLLERQEISLMFILNSLLKLTEIQQYFNMSKVYTSEVIFLTASLSYVLSGDLDRSASRPGSAHSSAISVPKINQLEQQKDFEFRKSKIVNSLRTRSLSYIILLGSYKEKLTYIIQFLNNLPKSEKPDSILPSVALGDDEYEGYNSEDQLFGKQLYLSATREIKQKLPKLSYKFLSENVGIILPNDTNYNEAGPATMAKPTSPVDQIKLASTTKELQNLAKRLA